MGRNRNGVGMGRNREEWRNQAKERRGSATNSKERGGTGSRQEERGEAERIG